ncbi:MAG TPA: MlaD family protein [Stellaceae bacterium]|nr:MlaD family protein [Stellaceae bacterium]
METRANYVAVGAFVVVLLLGAAGVLLWIIGSQFDVKVAYFHMSFAGSVSGLTKDSAVRYNGVPVGKVSDIAIDKDNPGHITVIVALDPGTVIRQDAVASLASQGLTGGSYVEISGGTNKAPPFVNQSLPPGPLIASRTGGLQSLFNKAPEVMEKLLGIEDQIHDILAGKNRAAIDETVENIRKVTAAVAAHSADIEQIIANTQDATKHIDALALSADNVMQKASGVVDHANDAVGHVDKLIGHADKLVGNVDTTINEARPGIRDFSQRGEKQLEQLIGNFNALVIKVSRVVDELERDPAKFLFGDHNQGYKPK